MNEVLRKGFLLGLGAFISGKERLEIKLKELVEKNELTQSEAKSLMESYVEKGAIKKDEWTAKKKEQAQQKLKDMGIATVEDVEALKHRLAKLEAKLAEKV